MTYQSGSYLEFEYDHIKKNLIRYIRYPIDSLHSGRGDISPRFGFLLFDRNYNFWGEGIIPSSNLLGTIFTDDGIALFNVDSSEVRFDSMFFDLYQYEFYEETIDKYRKEAVVIAPRIKEGGWAAYMNEIHGVQNNEFAVLFVSAGMGCEGCLDYMIEYFLSEQNSITITPIYCVVAGKSLQEVNRKLATHRIDAYTHITNLLIDPSHQFLDYTSDRYVQGRVLLFSGGKLSGQLIANPASLSSIEPVINQFFDLQDH